MRASGVRRVIVFCSDYKCSHLIEMDAVQWPDDPRLSNIEARFVCEACSKRGADVRPRFPSARMSLIGGHRRQSLSRLNNGPDLLLGCPCRPRRCAAARPCPSLCRARPARRTHGPPLGRPWSRRPSQRADGQRGLCPRQRANICCSLSHLGSFCPPYAARFKANVPDQDHRLGFRAGRDGPCRQPQEGRNH
jgi:hypothetical protein